MSIDPLLGPMIEYNEGAPCLGASISHIETGDMVDPFHRFERHLRGEIELFLPQSGQDRNDIEIIEQGDIGDIDMTTYVQVPVSIGEPIHTIDLPPPVQDGAYGPGRANISQCPCNITVGGITFLRYLLDSSQYAIVEVQHWIIRSFERLITLWGDQDLRNAATSDIST